MIQVLYLIGFQTWVGYSDVKSSLVYFYAQKDKKHNETGRIPFEFTRLNIGGAMNISSGIFTVPRNGIYSFDFSGVARYPTSPNRTYFAFSLTLNGNEIGRTDVDTNDDNSLYTHSLHSTLELKTGDEVWISIHFTAPNTCLYDDWLHYTHFSGHLVQEKVARSYISTSKLS